MYINNSVFVCLCVDYQILACAPRAHLIKPRSTLAAMWCTYVTICFLEINPRSSGKSSPRSSVPAESSGARQVVSRGCRINHLVLVHLAYRVSRAVARAPSACRGP